LGNVGRVWGGNRRHAEPRIGDKRGNESARGPGGGEMLCEPCEVRNKVHSDANDGQLGPPPRPRPLPHPPPHDHRHTHHYGQAPRTVSAVAWGERVGGRADAVVGGGTCPSILAPAPASPHAPLYAYLPPHPRFTPPPRTLSPIKQHQTLFYLSPGCTARSLQQVPSLYPPLQCERVPGLIFELF
jgi:hypothetical protein